MADLPGIRRAVYPIVRYVDTNPDNTHRIVWTRCDLHLGIHVISIPEQGRVVVVGWISHHLSDHPIPERERVVLAAARHRGVKEDLAFLVIHPQDRCFLRDNHLDRPTWADKRLAVFASASLVRRLNTLGTRMCSPAMKRARGLRLLSKAVPSGISRRALPAPMCSKGPAVSTAPSRLPESFC